MNWIAIKDSLPKKSGPVLCFFDVEPHEGFEVFNFDNDTKMFCSQANYDVTDIITHWCELTDPRDKPVKKKTIEKKKTEKKKKSPEFNFWV